MLSRFLRLRNFVQKHLKLSLFTDLAQVVTKNAFVLLVIILNLLGWFWGHRQVQIIKKIFIKSQITCFLSKISVSWTWTGLIIDMYVPKLLLSYVYVLDIRARLMRALESTTSCKRILISRAPMCRKRKFDLHLSVFKDWSWFLSSYWLVSAPFAGTLY